MDNIITSVLIFLGLIFISRILNEKANKQLDDSKKAELVDLFSKNRIYNSGILITIFLSFFICNKFKLIDPDLNFGLYIGLILIFLIVSAMTSFKKLKNNNFPNSYIKSYIITTSIKFIGIIFFFAVLLME